MDFKKGNWNPTAGFNFDNLSADILDDKMAKNIIGDLRKNLPPGGFPKHKPVISGGTPSTGLASAKAKRGVSSNDQDLVSKMASRLQQLEQINQALRSEIKEKSLKIETLEKENFILQSSASSDFARTLKETQAERDQYKVQCKEMETFLQDYGLKWVGKDGAKEGKFDEKQINQELAHLKPTYKNNLPSEIDTEVLTRRIEELNFIAEKQRVVKNRDGLHQFQKHNEVLIFFFKNGLIIKGFPFYPYYSKEAQSVLSDILDGYFPYDLKKKYPEGVPLKPVDCTDDTYSSEIKGNPKFKNFGDLEKDTNPMSKEEFLNQFPKEVIKAGNIIPIREELEKRFKDTQELDVSKLSSNEPIIIENDISRNIAQIPPSDIVTMRIRSETGKRTLILKLLISDSVGKVYQAVSPYLENRGKNFEIRTTFPNKAYAEDEIKTLKELGLAPSCALVIVKLNYNQKYLLIRYIYKDHYRYVRIQQYSVKMKNLSCLIIFQNFCYS